MNDIAIKVEEISKEYHIGAQQKVYDRLSDRLTETVLSPFRKAGKLLRGQPSGISGSDETIWALKNVSCEIRRGDVVGIIGRNGAGKSTLLKVLSRITEPNQGRALIYGRVGSLLEVGTGFHPELTGRENIYLNGAILGMKRAEITRKFDEIVAFAEIDKFIDTPVKHYSSGMYVRLAFSVAAHLETEILMVDEVLAVGDLAFQKKCLGKMDDVGKQGRTVLFVSHNMGLMQTLCQRGIFLQQGMISAEGSIAEVVEVYLQTLEKMETQSITTRTDRRGKGKVRLVGVEICGVSNGSSVLKTGSPAKMIFTVSKIIPGMSCDIYLFDSSGQPVVKLISKMHSPADIHDSHQGPQFICEFDQLLLMAGRYRLDVAVTGDNILQDSIQAAKIFDVSEGPVDGRSMASDKRFHIHLPHRWRLPYNE